MENTRQRTNKQERIVCAAVWFQDKSIDLKEKNQPTNIEYGYVVCGWRHGSIFPLVAQLKGRGAALAVPHIQGFLTSKNRFVDRVDAHKIFVEGGGIPDFPDELYSEDLY